MCMDLTSACRATELAAKVARAQRDKEVAERELKSAKAELLALMLEVGEKSYDDDINAVLVVSRDGADRIDGELLREKYPAIAKAVTKKGKGSTFVTVKPSKVA